ncbi:hypothetical protein [Virgibacillus pantothenticus]|uniref:hypothetical protein n=1 Tax=Virgibacillus pantothenticus TaxID=1473 RepID=UPI0009858E8E|nr:hypothetical protein [Virgibacillus pantothenticus]
MAKLEGVEVVDMKDGEVTKVEYEGAEYSRIDVPKGGDIGLRVNTHIPRRAEVGRYYKITSKVIEEYRYVCYVDEEGDEIRPSSPDNFHYFRKVETPTLDSRVTKLEQDVEEIKEKQQAEESEETNEEDTELKHKGGDKVRIVKEGTHDFSEGEVVEIFKVDEGHDGSQPYKARYSDGVVPDCAWVYESEIEPAKPKIGDKVRVVNAFITNGEYKNGDVLTVRYIDNDGDIYVKEHDSLLFSWEVEVMTAAEIKAWEK